MANADFYPPYTDESADTDAADESSETTPDNEKDEGMSALIPLSLVKGKEVGDKVTFDLVHLYDDEAEIKRSSESPDKGPPKPEPGSMAEGMDRMSAMAG